MLFNSYEFVFVYLPLVLAGYFLISKKSVRASNIWLLAASFFFYGWWDIRFVPLLSASIVFNYIMGTRLLCAKNKKPLLAFAVGVNIALLAYFKYSNFFLDTINRVAHTEFAFLKIALPLGISFWTFTQTAFLVDAYRAKIQKQPFFDYALFVMIFPHLISGPIINHAEMMPQFEDQSRHVVNWDNIARGTMLFALGLFKKVAIADSLAPIAAYAYGHNGTLPMLDAWLGVFAYAFQIYFDFSAYSEMAVGLGKMFNIDFPTNFDSPYKSASTIELWQRWHMTLGRWIRDYLYIPLGGNRKGQARKMLNLFICMTISGLWHGAGWTFVIWGMYEGALLVINHLWRGFAKARGISISKPLSVALTFAFFIAGTVFFRAETMAKGAEMCRSMFNFKQLALFSDDSIFAKIPFLKNCGAVTFASWTGRTFSINRALLAVPFLAAVVFLAPNAMQLANERFKPNAKWLALALFVSVVSLCFFSRISVFLYFNF